MHYACLMYAYQAYLYGGKERLSMERTAPNLTAGTDLNAELATVVATKSTAAAPDQSLTQTMLGMSLGLIDVTPSAKRWLASHMMFGLR